VARSLVDGLLLPVRWREVQQLLAAEQVDTVVEVGPGGVLAGMAKRALPHAAVFSVASPEDVATVLAHLKDVA
jgi:[acyl-carrier-protein] S-malonyltransferase